MLAKVVQLVRCKELLPWSLDFFTYTGLCRFESVTLPPNRNEDLGEADESLPHFNTETFTDFHQTSYFAMVFSFCSSEPIFVY